MAETEITTNQSRFGSRRYGLHTITATPPLIQHDNPLVIIPGYLANGNPKVFENVAREFAELGRKTTIVTFTGWYPERRFTETAQERSFPDAATSNSSVRLQANQADALLNYLGHKGLKPDVAAHSLGIQSGLTAIITEPDQFGDIFLGITPAGLNKHYPIPNVDVRFAKHFLSERWKNRRDKEYKKAIRRYLRAGTALAATHPLRVWRERQTVKNTNLVEVFNALTQDPHAPNMLTLAGETDPVFGPNQLAVAHLIYEGGHNDLIAGRLTSKIDNILTDNKRQIQ